MRTKREGGCLWSLINDHFLVQEMFSARKLGHTLGYLWLRKGEAQRVMMLTRSKHTLFYRACFGEYNKVKLSIIPATYSRWYLTHGFFYPEDGGDTSFWNVDLHKIYAAPHPRKRHSSSIILPVPKQKAEVAVLTNSLQRPNCQL
jgi:hypothetical protein